MQIVEIRQLIKEIVLHTNSGGWQYAREPRCAAHRCIRKSGMRRATIEISKTVRVSLNFADRNSVQLTVANTESKPAAARIICNCPRLMFGRLMIEYRI